MDLRPTCTPGLASRALAWLDRKSSPQGDTRGDFDKPAYSQALLNGSIEGFALGGVAGVAISCAASSAGVFVEDKTGSSLAGLATGVAIGAGVGLAASAAVGGPIGLVTALGGAVLGGYATYRGSRQAAVRDGGGLGALIAGSVVHGPAKVAAGVAAALAVRLGGEATGHRALLSGAIGAALGAGLAAVGVAPVGVATAAAVCGLSSVVGTLAGPRYSQFFRNMSKDFGSMVVKQGDQAGIKAASRIDPRLRNCLGALPASMVKEGFKGFMLSDGAISAALLAASLQAVRQVDIFLHAHVDPDKPAAAASNAPADDSAASRPAA